MPYDKESPMQDGKTTRHRKQHPLPHGITTFDITEVVGTVEVDINATDGPSARGEAFRQIGVLDRDGIFQFPNPDGSTLTVTVETGGNMNGQPD
jgi:hypothetical protein